MTIPSPSLRTLPALTVSERIINVLDASADDGKVHAKERIETTSLYMNQYKELRYTGYAESFDTPMLKLRSKEIVAGNREQTRRSMQIALCTMPCSILVPFSQY